MSMLWRKELTTMENKNSTREGYSYYTTMMMVFGPLVGLLIATWTNGNIGTGLALGLALGITIGSLLDWWGQRRKSK